MTCRNQLLLAVCLCLSITSLASAQQPSAFEKAASTPPPIVGVIRLEHTDAKQVVSTISGLLGRDGPTLTCDPAMNSIIMRGSASKLEEVEMIVNKLDIPREDKAKEEEPILKIFQLKFAETRTAGGVIESVLRSYNLPVQITAEPRLNRLFASYPEELHKIVEALVEQIDVQDASAESKVMQLGGVGAKNRSLAQLMSGVAKDADVDLEYIPDINVAVVRGKKEAVSTFTKRYTELMQNVAREEGQTDEAPADYIVTAAWFMSDKGKANVPPRYAAVVKRAGDFGIDNLNLVAQVLARTSVKGSSENPFHVSGHADIDNTKFQISAAGDLSAVADAPDTLLLNIELDVHAVREQNSREASSSVQVQMRIVPGKPAIIAAAPISGQQSLFVIEVIRQ